MTAASSEDSSISSHIVYDSIVVGSGVSGLRVAHDLTKLGKNVLVLEAQDYVGGRILQNTDFIKNKLVEFGAEICHGSETAVYDFFKEQNEPAHRIFCWAHGDCGPNFAPVNNGIGLYYINSPDSSKPRMLRFDDKDEDFCRLNDELFNIGNYNKPEDIPIDLTLEDYLKQKGHSPEMIRLADAGYANTWCSPMRELSAKQMASFHEGLIPGEEEEWKMDNSYRCLVNYLKKDLEIKLNSVVKKVELFSENTDELKKFNLPSTGGVRVTLENGDVFFAKSVVVSVSISVLQRNIIEFVPPLDNDKLAAIKSFKMNNTMKVFVKFKRRCWPKNLHGIIVADEKLPFPEVWFNNFGEASVESITNDLSNATLEDGEKEEATCYATSFITSDFANALYGLPQEEICKKLVDQLEEMFGILEERHFVSNLEDLEVPNRPSFKEDLPTPSSVYISGTYKAWNEITNPYIGGGYAASLAGHEINASYVLAKPVQDKLFFVGEAVGNPGTTVHAALDSAIAAVKELKNLI